MPSSMLKLKMKPRKRKTPSATNDTNADYIVVMLDQEKAYQSVDYLSIPSWRNNKNKGAIDEFCREQIVEWTYRVVDYFRIDREVVSVSLNYLDRFLCTRICDRPMFKLAATTTLHMAVKVVHPQKLGDLGILSDLSRGEFNMEDVTNMERDILNTLNWKLHPPTPAAMSMILLDYLQLEMAAHDLEDLYFNVSFFAELGVFDYQIVTHRPSTVALASILNALEGMMRAADLVVMDKVYRLGIRPRDLSLVRNRLWELYERSEECALHNDTQPVKESTVEATSYAKPTDRNSNSTSSPVSVASERCGGNGAAAKDTIYAVSVKSLRNSSW